LGAYVLGGACAGLAVVAKFSYLVAFLPAISILLFWPCSTGTGTKSMASTEGRRLYFKNLLAFAGASFLAIVPHLIKNSVLFGAPLAPFIGGGDGQGWTNQTWFDVGVTRQIIFTYPFALVFGRYPMQGGNVSFLLLAFFPIWLLFYINGKRISINLRKLFLASVTGVFIWVYLRPSIIAPRYLLATLLIVYPVVAKSVESLWADKAESTWVRRSVIMVSFLAMFIFAYPILPAVREAILMATDGDGDRRCALASAYCVPLQRLNIESSKGQRVYYAGYYTYWLKDDLLLSKDTSIERSIIENSSSDHLRKLSEMGFTWLVVEKKATGKAFKEVSIKNSSARNGYSVLYEDDEVVILRVGDFVRNEGA
jgi:hypothetical protein